MNPRVAPARRAPLLLAALLGASLATSLAAPAPDQMAAMAAAKEVQGTCGACHKQNREGDNQTGFKFKPGLF